MPAHHPRPPSPTRRAVTGFTLIEVMITVAIIGILTAVALPSYRDYVVRGHLVDGINGLAAVRAQMERHFQDNRSYDTVGTFTAPCAASTGLTFNNFTVACDTASTGTTFRLKATGSGPVAGFVFKVDQAEVRSTTAPAGWPSCATAWLTRKGAVCP